MAVVRRGKGQMEHWGKKDMTISRRQVLSPTSKVEIVDGLVVITSDKELIIVLPSGDRLEFENE